MREEEKLTAKLFAFFVSLLLLLLLFPNSIDTLLIALTLKETFFLKFIFLKRNKAQAEEEEGEGNRVEVERKKCL